MTSVVFGLLLILAKLAVLRMLSRLPRHCEQAKAA
jgi:hypothetical protein